MAEKREEKRTDHYSNKNKKLKKKTQFIWSDKWKMIADLL